MYLYVYKCAKGKTNDCAYFLDSFFFSRNRIKLQETCSVAFSEIKEKMLSPTHRSSSPKRHEEINVIT